MRIELPTYPWSFRQTNDFALSLAPEPIASIKIMANQQLPLWSWSIPTLHPETHQPPPRPTDEALDSLYLNESEQSKLLGGLRIWELAELYTPVSHDLQQNNNWAAESFLPPNESDWFAVFTRSHWLVSDEKILENNPGLRDFGYTDQDTWSVDDERIWKELSRVIELANSFLKTAAEGEWLQNALQYHRTYKILEEPLGKKLWTEVPRENVYNRLTAPAVCQWIDSGDFHKYIRWALDSYPVGGLRGAGANGATDSGQRDPFHLITMNVETFLILLDPTMSAMKKVTARFAMAVTMVHELACGNSFINGTFGADLRTRVIYEKWPECFDLGVPYGIAIGVPWPESGRFSWFDHGPDSKVRTPDLKSIRSIAIYPAPSSWVCRLQQRDFWTGDVAQYGLEAIRHPNILVGQEVWYTETFSNRFSRPVRLDDAEIDSYPPSMRSHLRTAITKIKNARVNCRQMRPWHYDTRLRWSTTPWSHITPRRKLWKLTNSVFTLPRTGRKEADAMSIVENMGWIGEEAYTAVFKSYNPETMEFDLKIEGLAKDIEHRCFKAWFYYGISHLVYGSLPARENEETSPAVQFRQNPIYSNSRAWHETDELMRPWRLTEDLSLRFSMGVGLKNYTVPFTLRARHTEECMSTPQNRSISLAEGLAILNDFFFASPFAPQRLRVAVNSEYTRLVAQLRNQTIAPPDSSDGFLSFGLKLPTYVDDLPHRTHHNFLWHIFCLHYQGPPRFTFEGEDDLEMWTGLAADDGFSQVQPQANAMRVVQQAESAYLTIAELYDLRRRKSCVEIVLIRSGLDLEVYDQEVLLKTLDHSEELLQQNIERTPYGWCLNKRTANEFRARNAEAHEPWAKVVQWVTPEEVYLQDGKEGRRTWITTGGQVYDVTEFALHPADDKLQKVLLSRPGGNPMLAVHAEGYRPREVVKRLLRYRVAMLFPVGLDVGPKQVRTFTSEELGWHQFRETGMYVQIYNDVYDVSTVYLDMHPGGIDALSAYAGRDATEAFEKYHLENREQLLESIQAMKIGRMIKTYRPRDEVAVGDVRLRDCVFRGEEATAAVKDIQGSPTEEFEAALKRIANGGEDEAIVTLWNKHQDLIVGRYAAPHEALSTMTDRQLKAFDGQTIDSSFENAAFMAVDDTVYDISTLLQFGHPTVVSGLRQYAGRTCTDKVVARNMKTRYAFRAVARLSEHEQKDGPSWDPRRLRHDIADVDLQKLKSHMPKEKERKEEKKKRKFEEMGCGAEMSFRDPPPRLKKPMAEPVAEGERPAKRRAAEPMSLWLDWRTEELVGKLQKDFASGKLFAEWQAKEMEREEDDAWEMEGYWEKAREEETVGA
ncbi:hypothetical protein F5X68DRAFT_259402 [Plectosphaerella plurivora]|uniref:Cytochrome b5 heme-binding domain-containing protein n=1 Tax=Plectosphaerella plurivora TaxID=936078 RepID=A0A9P8VID5_9PEZI|nr:hypothetical protein F5X68DRAFT_259402 [Plectosphaerella plurivora]